MFCTNCGNPVAVGLTECPACKTKLNVQTVSAVKAPLGQLVGRTLGGRYQLHSLIGSGGMGEIYRAQRTHIGDTVAVKVLRSDVVGNDKSRQRFFREARAAALLHHPNAVVIHDFGEEEGGIAYIVMELLVGRSLRDELQAQKRLAPLRAYGIMRQAAAALEAGHRAGIVHRDIKPENIILLDSTDDSDHVKILDFGIAKLRDAVLDGGGSTPSPSASSDQNNLTNAGMVIGTPNYMSPEQCQGEEADARSDIYSLGVVMYETLTGSMPFTGKTATSVAIKHVTEAPRSLRSVQPDIPAEIEAVVLRSLAKMPASRYDNMLEFARAFAQALQSTGITHQLAQPTLMGLSAHPRALETNQITSADRPTAILPSAAASSPLEDHYQTSISDTPVSGSMPAVVAPAPPVDWDLPTVRPKSHEQTDQLPPLTEIVSPPHDDYATMIPEGPESPARPNPFAQKELASPSAGTSAVGSLPAAQVEAVQSSGTGLLIELPATQETAKLKKGRPASQVILLIGLVAALLTGGAWLWSVVTQDNGEKRLAPTPTPAAAQVSPTVVPPATLLPPEGMVLIPGGEIVIGRADGEENERPPHKVAVAPFYLDMTEVTRLQYSEFLAANLDHPEPPSWKQIRIPPLGTENLPVTDVTWRDASDYAAWKLRRLPTEEEWEYAARGPEGRIYPWGDSWQPGHANALDDDKDKRQMQPVGSFGIGKSRFGVFDLAGNAWEWTNSDYVGYEGTTLKVLGDYLNLKVIRGGSYTCLPKQITSTYRRGWPAAISDWPDESDADYTQTGFRTAQDVPKR